MGSRGTRPNEGCDLKRGVAVYTTRSIGCYNDSRPPRQLVIRSISGNRSLAAHSNHLRHPNTFFSGPLAFNPTSDIDLERTTYRPSISFTILLNDRHVLFNIGISQRDCLGFSLGISVQCSRTQEPSIQNHRYLSSSWKWNLYRYEVSQLLPCVGITDPKLCSQEERAFGIDKEIWECRWGGCCISEELAMVDW